MNRAYATLQIKAIDEKSRKFSGIASTPSTDRMGDVVEPKGAEFKLPIPLLWQHDHRDPIGWVTKAKVTSAGIEVEGEVADFAEEGELKARLKKAWDMIKAKLVRGLSIGFNSIESARIDGTYGIRFLKWEWLELSAVTIPANQEATITAIKSLDEQTLAALGRGRPQSASGATSPGASGTKAVHLNTKPRGTNMTTAEQIAALEAARAAKAARMAEIMQKAADEGRSTDDAERQEFDNLSTEVKTADGDLSRLRELEKLNVSRAAPVTPGAGSTPEAASAARTGSIVTVSRNLPKGTGFTRYAMALARSKGNLVQAVEIAKGWRDSTPEVERVLKAAVDAGTTTDATWAAPLVDYQTLASEFIDLLRPATIIGKLTSLRRVPFNVRMPRQTAGGTYGWVGEKAPKPVGELAFDDITMRWAKASGIIVITDELARTSNPSAEAIVRDDMVKGIAQFLDQQFVDPTVAEVTNVSPASVTYGVTPIQASGTDAAAVRADVGSMFANMLAANIVPTSGAWIMNNVVAMRLSLMQNPLGQPEFPTITPTGGTFMGYPVVASESVPAGSDGALMIFINQNDVLLSEEGIMLDVSREASLQFNTVPDNPATASTVMVNLWQNNLIGLRAERYVNWKARRSGVVQLIESVAYGS